MSRMRAAWRSASASSPGAPGSRAACRSSARPPPPAGAPARGTSRRSARPGRRGSSGAPTAGLERLAPQAAGQPFAHPLPRHHDLLGPEKLHQGVDHEPPADDRVPPVGVQPRHPRALLEPLPAQRGHDLVDPPPGQDVPVQPRDRVAGRPLVDLRQVPKRPARPHQGARRPDRATTPAASSVSRACSRSRRTSRGVGGSDLRNASETRRPPSGTLKAPRSRRLPEARHLEAAPAEVEERPVLDRQAPDRAQEAVARLLEAGEGAHRDAELPAHPPEERGPVRGVPQRRRARGGDPLHPRPPRDRPEVPQRLVGPLQRLRGDAPGPVELPHEPERGAAAREHVQVPARLLPVHHDAAGVRADVDHGDRWTGGRARRVSPGDLAHGGAQPNRERRASGERRRRRT